jgi:dTDP-4-amino-4,6-dideoxygalactose transaminase
MVEDKPKKLIGGMFALPDFISKRETISPYDFLSSSNLFVGNARSAMVILRDILGCKTIWFPSYLCPTMPECAASKNVEVRFFPVDEKLKIRRKPDWIAQVKKGDLVVMIDYFGFPSESEIAGEIKSREGWVLEDATQALLAGKRLDFADFIMVSPRKFTGVPDGGVLISNCGVKFDHVTLHELPLDWCLEALQATMIRRAFDKGYTQERIWYALFKKKEQSAPVGYYSMSHISRHLLTDIIDFSLIRRKRIENYLFLLSRLKEWAIFPDLDTDTAPLGFPVRVENRDAVREKLFSENIYPPVHWDLENAIPQTFEESIRLSKKIMTLPCDQRYDTEDMERMVTVFKKSGSYGVEL